MPIVQLRKKKREITTTTIALKWLHSEKKARWTFHCEKCKVDHQNRKRINQEIFIKRTMNRIKILNDKYDNTTKE